MVLSMLVGFFLCILLIHFRSIKKKGTILRKKRPATIGLWRFEIVKEKKPDTH